MRRFVGRAVPAVRAPMCSTFDVDCVLSGCRVGVANVAKQVEELAGGGGPSPSPAQPGETVEPLRRSVAQLQQQLQRVESAQARRGVVAHALMRRLAVLTASKDSAAPTPAVAGGGGASTSASATTDSELLRLPAVRVGHGADLARVEVDGQLCLVSQRVVVRGLGRLTLPQIHAKMTQVGRVASCVVARRPCAENPQEAERVAIVTYTSVVEALSAVENLHRSLCLGVTISVDPELAVDVDVGLPREAEGTGRIRGADD